MTKLTLIDRAFLLKKTPLFSALDLDLVLAIADKWQVMSFDPDTTIFGINEEAYRLYFIVQGTVEVRSSESKIITLLKPEEFFGEEALFSDKPRAYEAISKTEAVLLALSRTNLFTVISECPSVAVGLLQAYAAVTPFRPRS